MKVGIATIQSVSPREVSDRLTRLVLANDSHQWDAFQTWNNIVFYYKVTRHDVWRLSGLLRDSLSAALVEHPLICGRLMRSDGQNDPLEIVANDGGVRFVEAMADVTINEFFCLNENDRRLETQLVFGLSIDPISSRFSPLFSVQVTRFNCEGLSIGISGSVLLGGLIEIGEFIKRWGEIHSDKFAKEDETVMPIYYLPYLKDSELTPSPLKTKCETLIYRFEAKEEEPLEKLWWVFIKEAESKLGRAMWCDVPVVVYNSSKVTKLESCKRGDKVENCVGKFVNEWIWEDLCGERGITVYGQQHVNASYWVSSLVEGLIIAVSSFSLASDWLIAVNVGHKY